MRIQSYKLRSNGVGRAGERGLLLIGRCAFTLTEVLVAVFVLAVVTLSLYGGFGTGFMLVDSAREDLRATQILTQKAEAIRLCTYSSLSSCPITFVDRYDPTGYSSGNGAGGTIYSGTLTTNVPSSIRSSAA